MDKAEITTHISELKQGFETDETETGVPEKVYKLLPEMLKTRCKLIKQKHKKDIFLVASLPVLASHLINVEIGHADGTYTPDLFTLIVATPGSGKGISTKARLLGSELQTYLIEQSDSELQAYEALPDEDKADKEPPSPRCLYIPANSSSRAMYNQIEANGGRGIIFENEIDTMLNATKQEWGDFSDICRKSFHHEPLSINRKSEQFSIQSPKLSICLTGTFDQFRAMFESAENGYFSRFAMLSYKPERIWQSHRPTNRTDSFNRSIETASKSLFELWQKLSGRDYPLLIDLMDSQWDALDSRFAQKMQRMQKAQTADILHASNNRAAIIALRVISIFTILRAYEDEPDKLNKLSITPTEMDFKAGLELGAMFIDQAIELYDILPNQSSSSSRGDRFIQFMDVLPDNFKTSEAKLIGENMDIPARTIEYWLGNTPEIKKVSFGQYERAN